MAQYGDVGERLHYQKQPSARIGSRSDLMFESRYISIGISVNTVVNVVVLVLLAAVLWQLRDFDQTAVGTNGGGNTPVGTNTASSSDDAWADGLQSTNYQCDIPKAYASKTLAKYDTWLILGSDLMAGVGVANPSRDSWSNLLADKLGQHATHIIVGAGQFNGNISQQTAWIQSTAEYRALLADRRGALVIVSAGYEWLLSQSSASLGALEQDLSAVFAGDSPLVPLQSRSNYPVLLLVPPNPAFGGLAINAQVARCSAPYTFLNQPNIYDEGRLVTATAAVRTLYRQFSVRYGTAVVDLNLALGRYSLAMAPSLQQSVFASNCRSYKELGHSMLADVLERCIQHQPYAIESL
jgi:hypothetical protein